VSSQVTGVGVSSEGEFGANEWLVDELYEQFKVDKNSVDKAWWPILEAYQPVDTTSTASSEAPAAFDFNRTMKLYSVRRACESGFRKGEAEQSARPSGKASSNSSTSLLNPAER